jgi:uncharacterized protein (TIGR00661 family)
LIAPLDWGLGHITRCTPIIQKLITSGHHVISCGNKNAGIIFKEHFPEIEHHLIDGYNVKYSKRKSQAISMIMQSPKFFKVINKEKKIAEALSTKLDIDYVISDNRFGFRSTKTTNIFICHQIHIQGPKLLMPIFYKINSHFIKQFDHCWIPDHNRNNNLSGILSGNPKPKNCSFIGPLSRFNEQANSQSYKYKYLAILSGPEPQRSLLEEIVIAQFLKQNCKCAIIGGKPEGNNYVENNIAYFNHLKTEDFFNLVKSSEFLIARSGYSNIMDLSVLNKNVILIPTPGQTEQEYLAKYHSMNSNTRWVNQSNFHLNGNNNFGKIQPFKDEDLLEQELTKIGL